jgi:hypothetical protein
VIDPEELLIELPTYTGRTLLLSVAMAVPRVTVLRGGGTTTTVVLPGGVPADEAVSDVLRLLDEDERAGMTEAVEAAVFDALAWLAMLDLEDE